MPNAVTVYIAISPSYTQGQQTSIRPQFSEVVYEASVNESNTLEGFPLPENGFLVVQCSTDNVAYSISDPQNAGSFIIDLDTGSLSATMDLDYEQTTSHQFVVICANVSDASLNDTAMVIVTIEPVNEFQPNVLPSTITLILSEFTPIEAMLISSVPSSGAVTSFTVSDRDQGPDNTITYIFANDNDPKLVSLFDLDPNTGTLSLNQTLDRDATGSLPLLITLRITIYNINPPVDKCPYMVITIFITESNDNFPIFSQETYTVTVPESFPINEVITIVICTDAD